MRYIHYSIEDLDGHFAGALARSFADSRRLEYQMVPSGDDRPFDVRKYVAGDRLIFLDWVPDVDIAWLVSQGLVVVISTRKAAEKMVGRVPGPCLILPQNGEAACELASRYFFQSVNLATRLVGAYKTWRKTDPDWDNLVVPFQYWLRSKETDPATEEGYRFLSSVCRWDYVPEECLRAGREHADYEAIQNRRAARERTFQVRFAGLRFLAVNGPATWDWFQPVWDPVLYDAAMSFSLKNGRWTVNLYTDKPGVNVAFVAERHGGGRAQQASFQVSDIYDVVNGGNRPAPVVTPLSTKPTKNGRRGIPYAAALAEVI